MGTSKDERIDVDEFFDLSIRALKKQAEKRGIELEDLLSEYAGDSPLRFVELITRLSGKVKSDTGGYTSAFNPDAVSRVPEIVETLLARGAAKHAARAREDGPVLLDSLLA